MNIKLPHSLLKDYLDTSASPQALANALSLCGPTVDRLHPHALDVVYDIEVITNRIDSVSAFGIAREAAAILPQFDLTAKLLNNPYILKLSSLGRLPKSTPANIQIMDQSLLPRLSCISLSDIQVKSSDTRVQHLLELSGVRSLNNVIDISNELVLRFGCPVHIFDLDKIAAKSLTMRESKKGEVITTIDGKSLTLPGKDIIIVDGDGQLIDLCGVMGGSLSEVNDHTTNVLLFVPTYEPLHIRKTSLAVQNRSLASQIYEKGPDPELTLPTLITGTKMLQERAGGKISSSIFDYYPQPAETKTIELDLKRINSLIGYAIPEFQALEILHSLGFSVKTSDEKSTCTIPTWRINDINIPEDLVEEIARVYGYYRLQGRVPPTSTDQPLSVNLLDWETTTKHFLSAIGFTEVLTSSLTSQALVAKSGLNLSDALQLSNPLSEDYEYMRLSLIPGLLDALSLNRQTSTLKIFELSNIYTPTNQKLPDEHSTLTLATASLSYRHLKGYLEALANHLHTTLKFTELNKDIAPFVTTQTARIFINRELVGYIGVIDPQVAANFSLADVIIANIDFHLLAKYASPIHTARPLPHYASVFEDVTIESTTPVGELLQKITKANKLIVAAEYLSSHHNNHTFHLEFNDPRGNLTQKQVTLITRKLQSLGS